MAGADSPKPKKPNPPKFAGNAPRKPLQVMHISKKNESPSSTLNSKQFIEKDLKDEVNRESVSTPPNNIKPIYNPIKPEKIQNESSGIFENEKNISMADLLSQEESFSKGIPTNQNGKESQDNYDFLERIVDDFDFDEDEFLAALDQNEPIGNTGEIAKGKVIEVESDGVYVDIGGKAPGFMPKKECGLGVITNIKELFPKGLDVEVLVTREQNADGMVTISRRALALRKSWENVQTLEKENKLVQVKINGFNRGGVTCDLEGLRGFIPRSQLENGEKHESMVGKTIGTAFLEVNPDTRKLVLSEKKAATVKRLSELKTGQLIEGQVLAIKPYGYFIELGGISGLLHQSVVTNGSIRSLSEVFKKGEKIKALITDIDQRRGRIGLNTALLEVSPGEIIKDKEKVMLEAEERAIKSIESIKDQEKSSPK